jgi:hypothetical protein
VITASDKPADVIRVARLIDAARQCMQLRKWTCGCVHGAPPAAYSDRLVLAVQTQCVGTQPGRCPLPTPNDHGVVRLLSVWSDQWI